MTLCILVKFTTADWQSYSLSTFIPIGLAVAAGIFAAWELPRKPEYKWKRITWILFFFGTLAASVAISIVQQKAISDQRQADSAEVSKFRDREQVTQSKLDYLAQLITTRPSGLSDADRALIKSFTHASLDSIEVPLAQPSKVEANPSILRQEALDLSAQIQERSKTAITSYNTQQQIDKEAKRKQLIASGFTEQQAFQATNPSGGGTEGSRLAMIEDIKVSVASSFTPQIQELLGTLDDLNLGKVRGYSYAASQASELAPGKRLS